MFNKYLHSFQKDSVLFFWLVSPFLGLILCFALLRLNTVFGKQLTEIKRKQAVIAQAPKVEAKIINLQGSVKSLILNGIISHEAGPMAIIDNLIVKAGDEIEGRKVVSITDHDVTVCDVKVSDKCVQLNIQE